jgi:transposase
VATAWTSASGQRVRAVPRDHRASCGSWPQRHRIYQDLVSEHGLRAKYASVRRFVARLRAQKAPEAHVVIHTEAGPEGQVDYGEGPMVRQPVTGKYRRTRLFVFTLGHSRKSIRLISFRSSSRIWAELHERAFRNSPLPRFLQ